MMAGIEKFDTEAKPTRRCGFGAPGQLLFVTAPQVVATNRDFMEYIVPAQLAAKDDELKEIAPHMTRAAVLRDPALAAGIGQFAATAQLVGESVHTMPW